MAVARNTGVTGGSAKSFGVEIDPRDVKAFQDLVVLMAKETNRDQELVIKNAARDFAFEAMKGKGVSPRGKGRPKGRTRVAPKTVERKLNQNERRSLKPRAWNNWRKRSKLVKPVWAHVTRRDGSITDKPVPLSMQNAHDRGLIKSGKEFVSPVWKNTKIQTPGRGFLRSGWVGVLRRLGKPPKRTVSGGTTKGELKYSDSDKGGSEWKPWREIANQIPFANKYEAEIMPGALRAVNLRMVKSIENMRDKRNRTWRS